MVPPRSEFNRINTWFKKVQNLLPTIEKVTTLIQQGKYAADVCSFIGETLYYDGVSPIQNYLMSIVLITLMRGVN